MRLALAASAAISLGLSSSAAASPAGPTFMIRMTVHNYAKFRSVYNGNKSARDRAGLTHCSVQSSADDRNVVLVTCHMADLAKAKAFASSSELAGAMSRAGVVEKPDFMFLTPAR